MPDLDDLTRKIRRPAPTDREWFRIETKAGKINGTKKAEVWIYDAIQPWATTAKDFSAELQGIEADEITLHLNSPGGDAFEGLAIYNALKDHPAKVTVTVDGLAASAASFIAQAGDRIRMNRGAQMMIHEARGDVYGRASDMLQAAQVLDNVTEAMAEIYASRVGGGVEQWREALHTESWYNAAEAIDVGLADEMVDEPAERPKASWDFSVFAYAGRDAAPPPPKITKPEPPETPAGSPVTAAEAARRIHGAPVRAEEKGAGMDPAKIREALGLKADASDDEVKTTLASAFPAATPPADPPADTKTDEPKPEAKPELATAAGTMTIDVAAWQQREERITRLEAQDVKRRREERDQVIANAVSEGKFPPARKEHWVRLWDADPEGTRQVIDGLARNVVPTAELGYAGDVDAESIDAEFAHLFPPALSQKGA